MGEREIAKEELERELTVNYRYTARIVEWGNRNERKEFRSARVALLWCSSGCRIFYFFNLFIY